MKLFFNFEHKIVLAEYNNKVYEMSTGEEVDYKCDRPLNSFPRSTNSQYIPIPNGEEEFYTSLSKLIDDETYEIVNENNRKCQVDGHSINIERKMNEIGEPYLQMSGNLPRYTWRGFVNIANKSIKENE